MMMRANGTAGRGVGLEVARMLATLFWVLSATAATVAALGALPGWIAGEGAGVRRVASLDEAERRLGARLVLPGYFPDRLAWPAAEIRVAGGRHGSASLVFHDLAGEPALQLLEATEEGGSVAAPLLAGTTVLDTRRTAVETRPATLASVLVNGARWHQLTWYPGRRAVVLRGRGELDELFLIARSVHGRGAP